MQHHYQEIHVIQVVHTMFLMVIDIVFHHPIVVQEIIVIMQIMKLLQNVLNLANFIQTQYIEKYVLHNVLEIILIK